MQENRIQRRRFMFTLNPKDGELPHLSMDVFSKWNACTYAVFQKETAPSTGTPHYQGYCEFKQGVNLATFKRKTFSHIHVQHPDGSRAANRAYCTKRESRLEGPWEFIRNPQNLGGGGGAGGPPQEGGQGARNDIAEFRDAIRSGHTTDMLWDMFPSLMARYRHMVTDVRASVRDAHRSPPEVHIYFGDPGTGKSRLAHELAPHAYGKVRGMWWDLYQGESDVIMDDFYGPDDYSYPEFLKLTDRYPYMAQVKGGMIRVHPKRIFITSNKHPRDWYCFLPEYNSHAFFRRVTKILEFRSDSDPVEHDSASFFI